MSRRVVILILTLTLVTGGQALAGSSWLTKQISVAYRSIKISIDGQDLSTDTEPFIFQGRTFVPLRAIGEAFGKEVTWDAANNRVIIGEPHKTEPPPQPATYINDLLVLRNVGPFYQTKQNFMIASRPFAHGIAVDIDSDSKKAEVVVDLKKQFNSLSGYAGVEDETQNSSGAFVLSIYGDSRELLAPTTFYPGKYPVFITKTVSNVNTLTVQVEWVEGGIGDYSKIKAVLADLKFQ